MGLALGYGLGLRNQLAFGGGLPFKEDLNLYTKGRVGLTMPSTVGSDVAIITPTFGVSTFGVTGSNSAIERLVDGGSYTLYFKLKQVVDSTTTSYPLRMGNTINTGRGIGFTIISGDLYFTIADGTVKAQAVAISSINTNLKSKGWVECFVEIDSVAKTAKCKFRKQSDQSVVGTDLNLNIAAFTFSASNNASGINMQSAIAAFADFKKFSAIKSASQCQDNTYSTDLQFFYPTIYDATDVSSSAYHLIRTNATPISAKYYSDISQYCLKYGYSVWRSLYKTDDAGYDDIYVPNTINGATITRVINDAAGYARVKIEEHQGSLSSHNLADSFINIPLVDKSDATRFSAALRSSVFYNAVVTTLWHPSELNYDYLLTVTNDGYKGMFFPKISDNSAYNRMYLTEILNYATNKTLSGLRSVLSYTRDLSWYHSIDYYFSDDNIRAQRGSKALSFNFTTKVLSLSTDNGTTFPITLNLNGILTVVNDAYIYANGNISFADDHHMYLSTDNLSTYNEVSVIGVDGNAYISINTYTDFRPFNTEGVTYFGETEVRVWGNYQFDTQEINVWFSKDSGATVKSIYRIDCSLNQYAHCHSVNYDSVGDCIYMQFGEAANSMVIKGVYDAQLDSWSFTTVGVGEDYYRVAGMAFYGDRIVINGDKTNGYIPDRYGIWILDRANLNDFSKKVKANYLYNYNQQLAINLLSEVDGQIILAVVKENAIYSSVDGGRYFMKHALTGGPSLTNSSTHYQNFLPKNNSGYFRGDIYDDTEVMSGGWIWEKGKIVMIKLNRL